MVTFLSSRLADNNLTTLIALALACYGLTWLLVWGDGPNDMLAIWRERMGVFINVNGERDGTTWIGKLLNCQICTSVWCAIPLTLLGLINPWLLYPLAAIGAVTVLVELKNE